MTKAKSKYRELHIDIETKPALVYTWQTFKPIIGIDQIKEPSELMCFSWRWAGEKSVKYMSEWDDGHEAMVEKLWELFHEAHAVVTYNGKKFDEPWIKGILIEAGKTPPSPWVSIDLYWAVRQNMRLLSNKMDYAARRLLGEHKTAHNGFALWLGCMEGDSKSRALMKRYSLQDTRLLGPLLDILRPWMKGLPNLALIEGKEVACTVCGSENVQSRGERFTAAGVYQQLSCNDCGAWPRHYKRMGTTELRS